MFDDYSCSYSLIVMTLTGFFFCYSLLDYFSQHLGEYLNVLSALESLNIAILKAMDKTKEVRIHQSMWSYAMNHLVLCESVLVLADHMATTR